MLRFEARPPIGLKTDAELYPEIDAETDEQRYERDRDQIELPDREQPDRGGDDQAGGCAQHDGCNDPPGAGGEPQCAEHCHDHRKADQPGLVGERG